MEGGRLCRAFVCALLVSSPIQAADIGGWFADQQRAGAQAASNPPPDACPEVIARAALDTAMSAYHLALCHLQAEKPDIIAARTWLSRSAELNFLPAHRLLRALQAAEAGFHSPMPHCHDLGEGRQICHGGAPLQPVAGAPAN